jgi:hypothetical protein
MIHYNYLLLIIIFIYFYYNIRTTKETFLIDIKTKLKWFKDKRFKEFYILIKDIELLNFLYDIKHFYNYSNIKYSDLIHKAINFIKSDYDDNYIIQILHIYHSFIYSIKEDEPDFLNNRIKLENILKRHKKHYNILPMEQLNNFNSKIDFYNNF